MFEVTYSPRLSYEHSECM